MRKVAVHLMHLLDRLFNSKIHSAGSAGSSGSLMLTACTAGFASSTTSGSSQSKSSARPTAFRRSLGSHSSFKLTPGASGCSVILRF